ncbi:hypothetical protein [Cetobacterium sp.]|uniref:hypothetical protein n=1 Tax=Cetobacterium sp. TaxID=2071632 RepID=UPI003F3BE94E
MISFIFKCFISFFVGILINDLTESNTSLKFLGQTIFTNHSSFQFDMRLETFISLITLTILSIIFIFFKNSKLIKPLTLKIIGYEFILFSFLKGLNIDGYDSIFSDKNLILIIGLFFIVFYLIILKIFSYKGFSNEEKSEKIIYDSRKLDLEKLKKYLENSNIVGIDSEWGQGKSYFVDYWRRDENITSILISVLNTSEKDVIDFVFKQLDKQLFREGQIEINSRVLKSFLSNQNFLGINFSGIFSSKTYKEALKDYKKALNIREKPLYIIFDDLDRVKEKELLIKVLNLGDEIQSNKLKILYLYDQKKLNTLELDREYIEKFIPLTLGLTKLNFFDILSEKLQELKISLSIDEFNFLKTYFLEKPQDYQELVIKPTPRNIEIFLKEIESMLIIKNKFEDIKNQEIIVILFFKIFYFESIYLNLKDLLESSWRSDNVLENLKKLKITINKEDVKNFILKQSVVETLGFIYTPKGAKDIEWNEKVKKNLNILYSLESVENLTNSEKAYRYINELLNNTEISSEEKWKKYIEIDSGLNLKLQVETIHGKEFLLIDWFSKNKQKEKKLLLELVLFGDSITNTMILSLSSQYILNNINFRKIIFDNLKNKEANKLDKFYLEKFIRKYFKSINNYDFLENINMINTKEIKKVIENTKLSLKGLNSTKNINVFKEQYESLDELEILFIRLLDNSGDLKVEVSFSKNKSVEKIVKELKERYPSKEEQFKRIDYLIRNNQLDEYLINSILGELLKSED